MHGVPEDLDLSDFVGSVLSQICFDQYQIQLHFYPDGSISVEGKWELRASDGELIDQSMPHQERDALRIHRCLGLSVVGYGVDAPESLAFSFDNGDVLRLFDSSRESESFTIEPGEIVV